MTEILPEPPAQWGPGKEYDAPNRKRARDKDDVDERARDHKRALVFDDDDDIVVVPRAAPIEVVPPLPEPSPYIAQVARWLAYTQPLITLEDRRFRVECARLKHTNKDNGAQFPELLNVQVQQYSGRQRLIALNEALAAFDRTTDYWRESLQRDMHARYTKAAVIAIYGREIEGQNAQVLSENGWKGPLKQEVIINLPRRYGKTFGTAMWVAAFLVTQPGRKVIVFSPSRRQSDTFLECIKKLVLILIDVLGVRGIVQGTNNTSHYTLIHEKWGNEVSMAASLPCRIGVRKSRGEE